MKEEQKNLKIRPPVVVVMGHVDHGKTTLLDYIRKTNLAAREAGGITQSIGAYEIEHPSTGSTPSSTSGQASSPQADSGQARKITFIDTPGHEAFQMMRSTSAHVADLAILIVAADEGVKPQTKEAIEILSKAKTPFVVAINKIDKKEANVERVKNELTAAGVLLEGYGGQISYHGISAKTGEGVNDLLDLILLATDLEHLRYNPDSPAKGFILEARLDHRRGLEATVILKDGMLRAGDFIGVPSAKGKIKILEDFLGRRAENLLPSAPALVLGFEELPHIGEEFIAGPSEEMIAKIRKEPSKRRLAQKEAGASPETLKLILKASDLGSLHALSLTLKNVKSKKRLLVIDESVGDINDGDIKNAIATGAIIIGFKVKANQGAKNLAEAHEIKIITSDVIYDLVKILEESLLGTPEPLVLGRLEILAVFNQEKPQKQLVGGRVIEGIVRNKVSFEIGRGTEIVSRGRILNLQSQKKDVGQVSVGNEAGLLIDSGTLIQIGDKLIIKK